MRTAVQNKKYLCDCKWNYRKLSVKLLVFRDPKSENKLRCLKILTL